MSTSRNSTARATQTLTVVSAPTSPEDREREKRKNLADAIKALARAEAKERQVPEAVERARAQVDLARRTLERAKEVVIEARKVREAELVDAAKSGQAYYTAGTSIHEARTAELAAQDQFDAATAALRVIEEAYEGQETQRLRQKRYEDAAIMASVHGTDRDVEVAFCRGEEAVGSDPSRETAEARARLEMHVNGVLLANAPTLVEETNALQAKLIENRAVLLFMLKLTGEEFIREPTSEAAKTIRAFLNNVPDMPGSGMVVYPGWDVHPAADPWKQAREALFKDAEAPLPER